MLRSKELRARLGDVDKRLLDISIEMAGAEGEAKGTLATEGQTLLREKRSILPDIEIAEAAEEIERSRATAELGDVETREAKEIASMYRRADLPGYMGAALAGRTLEGAHREFGEALGITQRDEPGVTLPWLAMVPPADVPEIFKRASTLGAAFDNEDAMQAALLNVFNPALATFLGLTPTAVRSGSAVFPKLGDPGNAAHYAQDGAVSAPDDTPWTTISMDAKRASAAVSWQAEDVIKYPPLVNQLRAHLRAKLVDLMDTQAVVGDGAGQSLTGLRSQLAQPAAVADETTFAVYQQLAANLIDGVHQTEENQVRMVARDQTLKHASGKVSAVSDGTALRYLRATIELRASQKIPAAPTGAGARQHNAEILAFKPANAFNRSPAAWPVWAGIQAVVDPYSQAGKAETILFLHSFANFDLIDSAAFARVAVKIAA